MSAESEANDLIASAPCCTILPAGTGKTEILATACKVVGEAGSRALVLTHTNAGVEAMRRRLRKLGVSAKSADVRTIASWSETWCRNYRLLGDIPTDADLDLDFDLHYRAAERILNSSSIRRVVKASWQIVLVDEYQDCRLDQHALILSLAQCLPTVVVGDPLQGVYNFRSQPTVDWERDVFESFPMLALPVVPHRWELSNPQLGEDLSRVRDLIEAGQPIDIGSLPSIRWVENSHYKRIPECKRTAELTGTSLVIHRTRAQCISLARNAGGMLEAMEDIAGKDLLAVASGMDQAGPVERLSLLLTFATNCISKLGTPFAQRADSLKCGVTPSYQMTSTLGPFTNSAIQARTTGNATDLRLTAATISRLPEIVIARKEIWQDFDRMLGLVARDSSQSFSDAAAAVRGRAKKFGRRPSDRVAGTPLLVKGLEFDHVLVMNAQQLSREELYVSLTRAQTSLTVMSPRPILPPP